MISSLSFLSMQQNATVEELLKSPFDLQKFKKIKKGANSGGADKSSYYFKPSGKGIYYHFFLFPPLSGYIGETPNDNIHLEDGLSIITFKPLGQYQYSYFDPTETLIAVYAKYNDRDLPELAFIGLDSTIIKENLGNDFIRKDHCFIYTKDKNVLVLNIKDSKVECLKYIRLNIDLTKDNIPTSLTSEL